VLIFRAKTTRQLPKFKTTSESAWGTHLQLAFSKLIVSALYLKSTIKASEALLQQLCAALSALTTTLEARLISERKEVPQFFQESSVDLCLAQLLAGEQC
jgi:hypothetical protein